MGDRRRKGKEKLPEYEEAGSSLARRTRARRASTYGGRSEDGNRGAGTSAANQSAVALHRTSSTYRGPIDEGNHPAGASAAIPQFTGAQPPSRPAAISRPVAQPARRRDQPKIGDYGPQSQWPTEKPQPTVCPSCLSPCLNGICLRCVFHASGPLRIGGDAPRFLPHDYAPTASGFAPDLHLQQPRQAHDVNPVPVPDNRSCPACRLRMARRVPHPWTHTCICDLCPPEARGACQVCASATTHATAPPPALPQLQPPPQYHGRGQDLRQPPPHQYHGRGHQDLRQPPPHQYHGRGHQDLRQPPPHQYHGRGQDLRQPPPRPQHQAAAVPPFDFGLCRLCGVDPARPMPDPWWHGCSCDLCYFVDDRRCQVCGRRGNPSSPTNCGNVQ